MTQIDASHFDAATAYISVSRFRVDDLTPLVFRTRDGGRSWTTITRGLAADAPVNVVREDPKTKGLLFAGTEREVYVSFNDGDEWQPLSLNLPRTSVRDLIVHGDDLAIATHGRGFWILDNMTPLREIAGLKPRATSEPPGGAPGASSRVARGSSSGVAQGFSPAFLYTPQAAYRLRRNNWTDTPLPPEFPAGKNPPDGAIIDYYLAADAAGPVTLQISRRGSTPPSRQERATLVRRYSSDDKPDPLDEKQINVPLYWARPPQLLSAAKGMHRFVWNLRYPTPGAVQRDFPISAIAGDTPLEPLGVLAEPGAYVVTLTVGGTTYTHPLTLTMDPRATITPVGLTQQFTLATTIAGMMNTTFAAIARPPPPAPKSDLIALNNDLATAYEVVEGADRAPTTQTAKAVAHLEQRLHALLKGQP